ncbi:MAG: diguanylate cyclase/phosphodiesterase (GGDEF & EAL domains) with PAS/PAC sensor(s) [uncultured Sphingomonadaceae bacterium]|uniref:Diguanylate cyclase/phosphodiesterase (GGDEF & EAL domains) with PAS/PAC sensor(S) n=1 Tax=uncultured Sphingomonadaceae bacterium TaxID=169976 RepID=A0A6J4TGY5_9SPHN|nr:MAG: diguanylate cyclase/phosphodiesterase (GGDEF & EAL domains) with PAS/PAC sensor(s) [uncultured Sphingomonadaceae bacterium]
MRSSGDDPTVFILSFRNRDTLRDAAARGGWRSIAARRGESADQRFLASGARVAVVDTRDERLAGMEALRALGPAIERAGAALLALIDPGDMEAAREAYSAGATHFWPGALDAESFDLLLRLSLRHSERARGPVAFRTATEAAASSWRWERGSTSVDLSPSLARQAGFGNEGGRRVSLMELFRKLDSDGRHAARNAIERLRETGQATAFAHTARGSADRLAHHVGLADDAVVGQVETLGGPAQRSLDADLPHAIERGEIGIVFQPQVSIASGRVVGVEALARWRHAKLGEIDAATLFAVAERSGLLLDLSRHVQRSALEAVAGWPAALAHLRVAINVTSVDIAQPDFADRFIAELDRVGIERRRITVEITEGGLIEDLASAARLLADLRAHGLRVAIDDFGTGYSSLAYLKALPLDFLKIDKQMAQDIEGSPRDRVVVRGVIDMARALGLAVVAEGVETERQLTLLAEEGCNYYQGYLYAPALTSEALAGLIEGRPLQTA